MYLAALSSSSYLSMNFPRPVLHSPQRSFRIFPVLWQWSTTNPFLNNDPSLSHIKHFPFCVFFISLYCCGVIPYCFLSQCFLAVDFTLSGFSRTQSIAFLRHLSGSRGIYFIPSNFLFLLYSRIFSVAQSRHLDSNPSERFLFLLNSNFSLLQTLHIFKGVSL